MQRSGVRGRLNGFQKTMLQWNDMYPYNAVHLVRIAGDLDLGRLTNALGATLQANGLAGFSLDRTRASYCYQGGQADYDIKIIESGPEASQAISAEIQRQLNQGFAVGPKFSPLRFFVAPSPGSFALGLAYFHVIADAESIVYLMRSIVNAYSGKSRPGQLLDLYPAIARGGGRPRGLALKLACSLPARFRAMRSCCRPPSRDPQDQANGFTFFSLGPGKLEALLQAARSLGVTLNDLLLALLLKSLDTVAPDRAQEPKRRQIAAGSVINIRKDLGLNGQRPFGVFLGFFVVSHAVPRGSSAQELCRDVGRETQRIKQDKSYLGTAWELALARLALSFHSPQRQKGFFLKHYPLWGGVTNLNLNSIWQPAPDDGYLDYFRAVSTGPVTPLVLSVTTANEVVNVGLSYRESFFASSQIEQIKNCFLNEVQGLKP